MKYYYRREDEDRARGPVTFRKLVLVVFEGELGPDGKVLAEGEENWACAGDMPGLFHMAGRDDVVQEWYAQQSSLSGCTSAALDSTVNGEPDTEFGIDELDGLLSSQEGLASEIEYAEEPAWQQRLRLVESQVAEERQEVGTVSQIGSAATEAVAELDQKSTAAEKSRRISKRVSDVFSTESLKLVVRVVFTIVAANVTAFGVINWSDTQAQRFPDPQMLANGIREFPLYGKCSPGEFMFLTIDVMLVAGVAGYYFSRKLEAISDD